MLTQVDDNGNKRLVLSKKFSSVRACTIFPVHRQPLYMDSYYYTVIKRFLNMLTERILTKNETISEKLIHRVPIKFASVAF